jgi:hypothetical protein
MKDVAAILILAGALLPTLPRSRDRTHISNGSNLRQPGLATQLSGNKKGKLLWIQLRYKARRQVLPELSRSSSDMMLLRIGSRKVAPPTGGFDD